MFGVLVIVLCSDGVADLGFGASKHQIPLVISSGVLRAYRLGACGARCLPLRAGRQMRLPVNIGAHHGFAVICATHSLVVSWLVGGRILRATTRTKNSERAAGFSKKQTNALLKARTYCASRTSIHKSKVTRASHRPTEATITAAEWEITISGLFVLGRRVGAGTKRDADESRLLDVRYLKK
jgi:hypothetical protein